MKAITKIHMAVALAMLSGCAAQTATKTESGLPSWVMNPTASDPEGIADVACVSGTGNLTVDRQAAIANARASLAQQLNLKVQAMSETYSRRTDTQDAAVSTSHFENVSRQVSQQNLSGTRPTKVDYVSIGGKQQLCAVVELSLKQKELFDRIVAATGAKLAPKQEEVLYEEFKASQARDRMDAAIKGQP